MLQLATKACVWSAVQQITASMSFWSRHLRQSTYCLAPGNFCAPKARCFSFTSHKATTFSLAMPPKWASPRPHVPMRAMFSLLLGASAPKSLVRGRMSPAAPVKAMDLRKWRRFMRRVWSQQKRGVKLIRPFFNGPKSQPSSISRTKGFSCRSSPKVVACPCPPSNRVAAGRRITRRIDATICSGSESGRSVRPIEPPIIRSPPTSTPSLGR